MPSREIGAGPMAVTYDGLPIGSGGAHGLGRIGLRDAYQRTVDFVAACAVVVAPRTQHFDLHQVPGLTESPEWVEALHWEFGDSIGKSTLVGDTQVDSALEFLEKIAPQPQNKWGMAPLWYRTTWNIAVVDPATGEPFPGQGSIRFPGLGYESRVTLILSNRASLAIELCIPDLDDERLRELVPMLQAHAPFKFSSKHWRRWTASRAGAFTSRKIDPFLS